MKRPWAFLFFMLLLAAPALAVETAPRISDREIIENLSDLRGDIKELKAGQNALEKRFDDMNNSVNKRLDILQWMLGLFITVAISLMGIMGRILSYSRRAVRKAVAGFQLPVIREVSASR